MSFLNCSILCVCVIVCAFVTYSLLNIEKYITAPRVIARAVSYVRNAFYCHLFIYLKCHKIVKRNY